MSDRAEKITRSILWLCLSVALILVPVRMRESTQQAERAAQAAADVRDREAARAALAASDDRDSRLTLLPLETILTIYLKAISQSTGHLYFTNVSKKFGHICATMTANAKDKSATSLPNCAMVEPYSFVEMKFMFGGDVEAICRSGDCKLEVRDAVQPRSTTPAP